MLQMLPDELGLAKVGIAPANDAVRVAYPWARSVISAAVSYLPPECEPEDEKPYGLIARIAHGADYHTVLREKLSRAAEAILSEHSEARTEVCVDTCPLPERTLAVLAGIAWRGKNGCIFVEGCGSYVALGEVVTDVELPLSRPVNIDRCGECEKCIRACPTGALIAPYTLDPARCISRLTQSPGIIPLELRRAMGNRIYGCDICQEVCPQNANVRPTSPDFAVHTYPGAHPELTPLINLSARDFKARVARSSIGWIGRTRIRRNAAIAAGNLRCEEAVPALVEVLRGESAVLRAHAAWALDEIGSEPRACPQ